MNYDKFDKTEFYFNKRTGENISSVMDDSHYHNLYEIYYITEGVCRYFIEGKLYDLIPGDVILIPEGVIHNTEYRRMAHTRLLINCSRRYIPAAVVPLLPHMQYHYRNPKVSEELYNLLTRVEAEYNRADEFSDGVLRCYMHLFFYTLAKNIGQKESVEVKNEYVEKAVAYINESYMYDISLTEIAAKCSVSNEHFSRMFKKETGMGFCEYVTLLRLKKAEAIIREGEKISVAELASRCGFTDSNYFSVRFKRVYGISPKKLQLMNK